MRLALDDSLRVSYGGEDHTGGADLRAEPWKAPEHAPKELADDARRCLEEFRKFDVPEIEDRIVDWLVSLFDGMAHGLDERALARRAEALAETAEGYPRFCFTKTTRKRARKTFLFVPAAKELTDFLDRVEAEERETARRLMGITDAAARKPERKVQEGESPRQGGQWGWANEAERMNHEQYLRDRRDQERRELAAIVRKKIEEEGAELPPAPAPRNGTETDREYVARVVEGNREFLKAEGEAMKRGGRGRGGRLKPSSPAQIAEALGKLRDLEGKAPIPKPEASARAAQHSIADDPPPIAADPAEVGEAPS